jgi:UDP-2-acetamido-2-deoxy-ribo-hexuluronate aminotransferase
MLKKLNSKLTELISDSLEEGNCIDGINTIQLDNDLKVFSNRKNAICVGSGTDALFFALKALNIGNNDEVLVPALSFIATATSVTRIGAKPVFVDINPDNALMDLKDAETKVTSKTKAVLFVDLYGNLPDFDVVEKFAKSHNLFLIEDAAQAFGCERNSRKAGSMGDVSIFSFDPTKPVSAFGTGGAVLTDNEDIAKFCRAARQNGKNPATGEYDLFGINSRISELQAALLNWQLETFDTTLKIRQQKAKYLLDKLKALPLQILVNEQIHYSGNFHKMVIACENRNELQEYLNERNIETRIHYKECLYQHPVLKEFKSDCPNAEMLTHKLLTLPFYPEIEMDEIKYLCKSIVSFLL